MPAPSPLQVQAGVQEQRQKLDEAQSWQAQLQSRLEQTLAEAAALEEAAAQVSGWACCYTAKMQCRIT